MQVVPHKCPCECNVDVSIHLPCAEGVTAGQGHLMWNRWNRAAPARQRRLWWSRSVPTTLLTCTNASMCERSWVVVVRGSVNAWRRPIMLLHFCIYFTLITGKLLPISIFAVVGRCTGVITIAQMCVLLILLIFLRIRQPPIQHGSSTVKQFKKLDCVLRRVSRQEQFFPSWVWLWLSARHGCDTRKRGVDRCAVKNGIKTKNRKPTSIFLCARKVT